MHKFIIFAILALTKFSQANVIEKRDIAEVPVNSCVSASGEWKCCATSPPIQDFRVTGCVNIQFLQNKTKGLKLKITFNDYTFMEEKFSDTLCYNIPYLKKMAKVCLNFYDKPGKDQPDSIFSSCTRFFVQIVGRQVLKVDIGCFEFPNIEMNNEEVQDIHHEESDIKLISTTMANYQDNSQEEFELSTKPTIWPETNENYHTFKYHEFSFNFPKIDPIESEITYDLDHQPLQDIEVQKTASYTTTIVSFSILVLFLILFTVCSVFVIKRYRGTPIRYNLFS